jgi:hypothetical protein
VKITLLLVDFTLVLVKSTIGGVGLKPDLRLQRG